MASSMRVVCPGCDQEFLVSPQFERMKIAAKCPFCEKEFSSQGAAPLEIPWKSQTIRDDFREFGDQFHLSLFPTKKREQNLRF